MDFWNNLNQNSELFEQIEWQCGMDDTEAFECHIDQLSSMQAKAEGLRERQRIRDVVLVESAKTCMRIRDKQCQSNDMSKRIKELIHE